MLLLGLDSVCGVGDIAVGDRVCEHALLLLGIVDTRCGTEVEVLGELQVEVDIAEEAPVGVTVVLVAVEHLDRILTVSITSGEVGELA